MANKYVNGLEAVTGIGRSAARAYTVLGAALATSPAPSGSSTELAPPAGSTTNFLREIGATRDVPDTIGTGAGVLVGGLAGWKLGHPVIGAIVGASIGRNGPALVRPEQRKLALRNLITTGGGVATSLFFGGSWGTRALTFVGGAIASGVAAHFAGLK